MTSLWERSLPLAGVPLRTVNGDSFTFEVVSTKCIHVTVKGGGVHSISRIQFDRVDDADMVRTGLSPTQLKNAAGVTKGPSYIIGIINELLRRGW